MKRSFANLVAWVALLIVVLVSGMALLGRFLGAHWLMSLDPQGIPMRITTAICFLATAGSLACLQSKIADHWKNLISRILGLLVILLAVATLATYAIEYRTGQEWLGGHHPLLNHVLDQDTTRMAVITAILFVLFGGILILLGSQTRRGAALSHILLLPAAAISYLIVVGYIFNIRAFFEWMSLGVALNTGIGFCGLCLAVVSLYPQTWLTKVFTSQEAGSQMARRLLLPLLLLPLLIGYLRLAGERTGLFRSEIGVALVVVTYTVCFLSLVWLSARSVNRTDQGRREAEERLRENEQRLRTILDALPVAIFLSDVNGSVVFTNKAVEQIWGISTHVSREHYGDYKGWWLASGKPVEPEQWALARTLDTGQSFINEPVELESRDGSRKIIDNFALPIRDVGGELLGVVVVTEDVTQRFWAQEQIRLAKEAAERTAEELSRSNRDLEQFAYVSSHDLQEPLRMVTGFMQLLKRNYGGTLDATADKYINFAVDGAKRMQQLIDDLLAYSRVGSKGRQPAPVDANELVRAAKLNLTFAIQETGARVFAENLPTVLADGPQLVQVFQNLIGNAIKFRSEEPPVIHVTACRDGDWWLFSIKDNGIGFQSEFSEKVFMIFQRLHTRDKYPGTGIGLAVCKKIIDRHRGRIWAESALGKGTTFYFTLPA